MITPSSLRNTRLFASLPDGELETIAARAADVRLRHGEWLIQEGEVPAFFVLLEGRLAVLKSIGGVESQINTYEPGDFAGELPLLLGSPAVASLRALDGPCRVARLEGRDFNELIVQSDTLSSAVMRAMAHRVGHLRQLGSEPPPPAVTVIGSRLDLTCHDTRDFLARNGVSYAWLDPENPLDVKSIHDQDLDGRLPVVRLVDGRKLVAPDLRSLAVAVGLRTVPARDRYDVIIVGGGPAGLAAAVYGASEGLSTLLVERVATGGQAGTSSRIENYLGFPAGLSGDELSARARQQAERFGADMVVGRAARALSPASKPAESHLVVLDDELEIACDAVILAVGVEWRRLGIPGVERFAGRGLFYGAARTEALSMRGKTIHLIGGGNSAGQAAMLFANYAEHVTLLVRGPALAASMSDYLSRQLATKSNITVQLNTEVIACAGDQSLRTLTLLDRRSHSEREEASDGVFVFIGAEANTDWLPDVIQRDHLGYLCTGANVDADRWGLRRDPFLLETSVPGIFAAGDARSGSIKRVAASVGEGSMAIAFVHQHRADPTVGGLLPSSAAADGSGRLTGIAKVHTR
jgi:thioredoxin reductase (NADPH)